MEKKRGARMTKVQINLFIDYLCANKIMLDANNSMCKIKWQELTELLNMESGARKTVAQWKLVSEVNNT